MAGGRERDMEEETRNQMLQNLFGDQSEEEEEDVDVVEEEDVEEQERHDDHASVGNATGYISEEMEGDAEIDGDAEEEAEGKVESEGQAEIEAESEGEVHEVDIDQPESEGEGFHSSPERENSEQGMESEPKEIVSEDEGYGQRKAAGGRRTVVASESEESGGHYYGSPDGEDQETSEKRRRRSGEEEKNNGLVRDVFGESDEDEASPYGTLHDLEQDFQRSPGEEGGDEKALRPEDIVHDDDAEYELDDENVEQKPKEKPVGPPLEMVVPFHPPPALSRNMNVVKLSNIMGIERKPFDPKTYVEEDVFVTDESGARKRIRLEENIARWRTRKNRDGTISPESNARIVKWKDGSMQLLIGNEVLDISVHESAHDQSHLYLRNGKGILQSQGRLLRKMRFMPSSLSSKSHRLLTALVDSRHKKVYKVKNCITEMDPEKEKEERERMEGQTIKTNELYQKKREKVNKKYKPTASRRQQLSPGFLEDDPDDEEESEDYYSSRQRFHSRHDDLEAEAQAERRIINAKKSNMNKQVHKQSSASHPQKRRVEEYSESEREESEYETDGEDIETSPAHAREGDLNDEEEEYIDEGDEEVEGDNSPSQDEEEIERNTKETESRRQKHKEVYSDEESPPRKKQTTHRRAVVFSESDDE